MATKNSKQTKGKNVPRKKKGAWQLSTPGTKWLNASLLKVIYVGKEEREKIAIFRVR
jgi:hypothetical protein